MRLHSFSVAIWVLLPVSRASAQQPSCASPADPVAAVWRSNILAYTSAVDSSWRASGAALGFPQLDSAAVVLRQDPTLCRRAAAAVRQAVDDVRPADGGSPSGRVWVFEVGPRHRVVVDSAFQVSSDLRYWFLFDRRWHLLRRLGH
jgi:hypothetical protein